MPLNKRDFSQLLLLAAGTMTDTNGASNFTQQFAVNGQRGTAAVFAMDGADSSDPEMGGATFTNFNVDAVQEIRSSSGWMPAEIGRGAAGFTDIITGRAPTPCMGPRSNFCAMRHSMRAISSTASRSRSPGRIPPFIRNEFGVTNGGPVVIPHLYNGRNRTFYFAEYQGFRQVLSDTEVIPVPTAAERSGLDTTAYPGRHPDRAGGPAHRQAAGALPAAERPAGPLWRAHLCHIVEGHHGCGSVLRAHRSPASRTSRKLFGRFTMANTTGPTTNPSQTAIDSRIRGGVSRPPAQRRHHLHAHAVAHRSPWSTRISFTRTTPSFPTLDRTDPALTFGDGLLRGVQRRRAVP